MSRKQDGKTERNKKPDKSNVLDRKGGLGRNGVHSGSDGIGQVETNKENSEAGNSTGRIAIPDDPDGDIGKILERLHLLEERYVSYVKAHQSRLEARLDESKNDERCFLEESRNLEADILSIAEKRNQTE